MADDDLWDKYWCPRVMVHRNLQGDEYAIHEVIFHNDGRIDGYTETALSPRCPSVALLKKAILALLASGQQEIVSGDLGYAYDRDRVEDWLTAFNAPVLEYDDDDDDRPEAHPV